MTEVEQSVGDYLQFEAGGRMQRFGWDGPWPPPEHLFLLVGGVTGMTSVVEDEASLVGLADRPGGADVAVHRCVRVSHSTLPPQTADSHVARGALYRPEEDHG